MESAKIRARRGFSFFTVLLIRAILLWSIISLHVLGSAAAFRRFFPRESPWFGFLVPALALVLLLNFIEHLVALPSLLWLLPFTLTGSIWALVHPGMNWKGFRLPAGIFLAFFAFTLTLRSLNPSICDLRDGVADLALISSFCMGEGVPPSYIWAPDILLDHYYVFGHYGASVLTRLLNLDIGTGYNFSSALVSAFDCFLAAAAAWLLGRHKVWITILAPTLMVGATTGASMYLWWTVPHFNPNGANDIFSGLDDPTTNPFLKFIHFTGCDRELMPPGVWSWTGPFHSTTCGLFLILFFTWSLLEILRRKAADWPWICVGAIPLLTVVTSTWAVPLEGLLFLGALFWIWYYKLFPHRFRFVLFAWGLVLALSLPTLSEYLTIPVDSAFQWTKPECHTTLFEFSVMWWPIYLPMVFLLFAWRKISPGVKTILIVLPIAFLGAELWTVNNRFDWTGKVWGYIYSVGWIVLVPTLCRLRNFPFRALVVMLAVSSLISFWAWASFTNRLTPWGLNETLHLEGLGHYRWDPAQNRIWQVLSPVKKQIILTGIDGSIPSTLAAFTGNRIYTPPSPWWTFTGVYAHGLPMLSLIRQRAAEVEDLYNGKCADPLLYLRIHNIGAVVIHPSDKIKPEVVETLKKQLSPYYEYVDCQGDNVTAGVFLFHPEMTQREAKLLNPSLPANHGP